ncbi:hypothetical protein Psest_3158 [Stutzerimonas stutzeri RCH2]|uniref:Uncharacterized protein n=1 Tax=Stutzerimonas stutzeri RCH2 TaxID=644801 RepID=L0GLN2_STUST|nr:hypothetical protein Psest_3158 [Stutzerimonas stutzeri RCH2]
MSCPDDFEFLLGVPTPAEMWQQHARLLGEECHELRDEVRALKAERRKLVQLYAKCQQELSAANEKAKTAQREANRSYVELVQLQNSTAYPFHYGHHDMKPKEG